MEHNHMQAPVAVSLFDTLVFSDYRILNVTTKEENETSDDEYDFEEYDEFMDEDFNTITTNDIYSDNHPWDTRYSSYRFRPDLWCDVLYDDE